EVTDGVAAPMTLGLFTFNTDHLIANWSRLFADAPLPVSREVTQKDGVKVRPEGMTGPDALVRLLMDPDRSDYVYDEITRLTGIRPDQLGKYLGKSEVRDAMDRYKWTFIPGARGRKARLVKVGLSSTT